MPVFCDVKSDTISHFETFPTFTLLNSTEKQILGGKYIKRHILSVYTLHFVEVLFWSKGSIFV